MSIHPMPNVYAYLPHLTHGTEGGNGWNEAASGSSHANRGRRTCI